MPTDWQVLIAYNPMIYDGHLIVKSWVEQYTVEDEPRIEKEWIPTGTSYDDSFKTAQLLLEQE